MRLSLQVRAVLVGSGEELCSMLLWGYSVDNVFFHNQQVF